MQKLHYSVHINATPEKVFNVMLGKETYPEWTKAFNMGAETRFEGSWDLGSEVKFVGVDENGAQGGLAGKIVENVPNEFLSIEYTGFITKDGSVDSTSDYVQEWIGTHESYRFTEENGGTRLDVDLESTADLADAFNDMWPKALESLKEIAEK